MVYDNLIRQNPMLNKFNQYKINNPDTVPFQNNQLINKNIHVRNALANSIQNNNYRNNKPSDISQYTVSNIHANISTKSNRDVIKDMLKPIKIEKNKKSHDVMANYHDREKIQINSMKGIKEVPITNIPYKCIIKNRDNIEKKNVDEIKLEDLIVHRSVRGVDDDVNVFDHLLEKKELEKSKINEELMVEFNESNRDMHKKKFEFKETFIKNMVYEENTIDENKKDFLAFYKKQKKDAEESARLIDNVTKYLGEDTFGNSKEFDISENTIPEVIEPIKNPIILKKAPPVSETKPRNILRIKKPSNKK